MNQILQHLRRNLVAYAALLAALIAAPTSAYAAATIRSADIVDGEVKSPDLAGKSVRSAKILDATILNQDLAPGSVTGAKVSDGSLTGSDLSNDTVSGFDVDESTLGRVPSATQGGLGRYGFAGSCDPESLTFVSCSNVSITLGTAGRLLVIGTVQGNAEADSDRYEGACRIGTSRGAVLASEDVIDGDETDHLDWYESLTVTAVTDVFPSGTHNVWVECNQHSFGAIRYKQARVVVVGLSSG